MFEVGDKVLINVPSFPPWHRHIGTIVDISPGKRYPYRVLVDGYSVFFVKEELYAPEIAELLTAYNALEAILEGGDEDWTTVIDNAMEAIAIAAETQGYWFPKED